MLSLLAVLGLLAVGACFGFLLAGVLHGTDADDCFADLPDSLADLEAQRLAQQNED